MPRLTPGDFYTTKELADVLKLTPRTVQRWVDAASSRPIALGESTASVGRTSRFSWIPTKPINLSHSPALLPILSPIYRLSLLPIQLPIHALTLRPWQRQSQGPSP